MNPRLRKASTWMPIVIALSFAAGLLTGGALLHRRGGSIGGDGAASKLSTILSYIANDYVDEVNTDSLLESIFPTLLTSLDPHSVYISAADLKAVNDELEGSFSGIGISFNLMTDTITVVEVISGGPSEAVGLMPGDRIITINDTVAAGRGWSNEKVISNLRGAEGTKVKLGIKRANSAKLLDFEVTRGEIPVTSIDAAYMIEPGTAYIKVNKFGRNTYEEFFTEAIKLRADGAESFVLDLRGNGGGYMEIANLMANEFLPAGAPIVSTRGRDRNADQHTAADGLGALKEVDVVVIIDEYSASASEILAGAIQDNDRGLVIGRRSFGKGLVQRQIDLPDSSAIRLTTARYYTPSGRSIQKRYLPGGTKAYQADIIERYDRGELFSADSIHLDKSITFYTSTGREVYGGGGIMPDIFVPSDSTGITSYYISVINNGVVQKFAFEYLDRHRERLQKASTARQVLAMLPDDDTLLKEFAEYAESKGIAQRWYYINISRDLLVNQLKAMIARNVLGVAGYYEVENVHDESVRQALKALHEGRATAPVKPVNKKQNRK